MWLSVYTLSFLAARSRRLVVDIALGSLERILSEAR